MTTSQTVIAFCNFKGVYIGFKLWYDTLLSQNRLITYNLTKEKTNMKTNKFNSHMDTDRMRQLLFDEAARIADVAESLADSGEPVSSSTKKTIRQVLSGSWLTMMNDESAYFFSTGNMEDFVVNREQVLVVLNDLT